MSICEIVTFSHEFSCNKGISCSSLDVPEDLTGSVKTRSFWESPGHSWGFSSLLAQQTIGRHSVSPDTHVAKSVLPYGFRGWWFTDIVPLQGKKEDHYNPGSAWFLPAWLEKSAQGEWMEGVGGFHSLAFKWALWSMFSADGNSDFWSGATHALSVCGMGTSAKSQGFWWVFPCFQPSAKSGRGAWIASSLRDVLWSTFHSVS